VTENTKMGAAPEKLPDEMRRRLHAAITWHTALGSWRDAVARMPDDLDVKSRHRLEGAKEAVLGLFAQVEAAVVDLAAVQKMLDTVEKVPPRAFADGDIMFFCLYNAMMLVEHLHDDVKLGDAFATISARRSETVQIAALRCGARIMADRIASRKTAA
jgi:hypothetical protein